MNINVRNVETLKQFNSPSIHENLLFLLCVCIFCQPEGVINTCEHLLSLH